MIYLASPIDLLPAPFDGYEVALCVEVTDAKGDSFVERIDTPDQLTDWREEGSPLLLMFTVYGHFPMGGVHAFADAIVTDTYTYEQARAYAVRLAETIAGDADDVLDMTFADPQEG